MKTSDGLSDSIPSVSKSPAKCEKCGATERLYTGVCVSCLLGEGLEAGDEVSRAVFESAIAEVNVPDKQWRLGDYEILDEIGRGGMGVIYLARQRHPQRIVAVKRVLDYHADSRETLRRFRREADAAASLDHPNILPIYEVSESQDGLPFFSMKFATGGSLRNVGPALRGKPRQCVQLMAKVARAVEYAHSQGILHRDLKPGNILLDSRGEPLVSDFGLAKWLDANKDLTKSLTTFGTPGYTAPEQAEGKSADLTPVADVYSLGAILFDLLAGRPPFLGSNALAVIRQAAEMPAPKLRSLSHSHDRDFETICARCLERDPKARYQSAGALATDLERWLDGRPIVARPISVPTRLGRWSRRNPKLIATGAACLLFGAAVMWLFRGELAKMLPPAPEKSIAVLPFSNLSKEEENAFFADGVQDEILTDLARIADLKVISRTSVMQYKSGVVRNLRKISQQLGVAHVVEGSVQRAGNRVRVNAQLVDARTERQLWGQTYDRELADVFAIQSEIAKAIASQLEAKLSPREENAIERPPTNDITAFELYAHAKNLLFTSFSGTWSADVLQGVDLLNQAVARDPSFFDAYCQLSHAHGLLYFHYNDHTPARLALAEAALQAASRLRPDAGETHLARAENLYRGYRNYDGALVELEVARQTLPNAPQIFRLTGLIQRRQGHVEDSIRTLRRAADLDPRNFEVLQTIAVNYLILRRYAEAKMWFARVLAFEPNDPLTKAMLASVDFHWRADTRPVHQMIDSIRATNPAAMPSVANWWLDYALAERDAAAAQNALITLGENPAKDHEVNLNRPCVEGIIARMVKDDDKGRAAFTAARAEQEKIVKAQPNYGPALAALGLIDAGLGRKAEALREGQRAVELLPREKDALAGTGMITNFAIIAAWVGERDLACKQLAIAVRRPGDAYLSYGQLKLHPFWDPLRGDPQFEKIVASLAPNETPNVVPEKSIAVLPFQNLSRDPDNAYFADGIQEEILTRLASIADLKVISRSSTQHYQSKPRNLSEIGKQLAVANILEGSVQKTADQVRVNVQLVNAQTDSHLWAETYDRKLTDLFGIESEIAKGIAESLRARLTGREEQALAVKPTNNSEAYDAYHRGRAFEARGTASADAQRKAIDSYERAVQLDPNFVLGWARLSHAEALFYFMNFDTTAARRDAAKKALENAQKLQPNSPETLLALGYYQYWIVRDYRLAKATLGRVRKMLPGSSEVPLVLAWVARREGNWDESVAYLEEGLALDPRNPDLLRNAAWTYGRLRQFPTALKLYDRALDVVPNDPELMAFKAGVYQAQGNLQEASKLLVEANEQSASDAVLEAKLAQLRLERNHGEAIQLLQARLAQFRFGSEVEKGRNQVWLALAQQLAGNTVGAKATAQQARNTLEPLYKDQPNNAVVAAALSLARAALGEKNSALKDGERAIMLLPSTKDRMNGPRFEEVLALIQMIFGETSHSIATLTQLLQTPCSSWFYGTPITPALLRLDPLWDRLRADPAFQKLCEEKQP